MQSATVNACQLAVARQTIDDQRLQDRKIATRYYQPYAAESLLV